MGALLKFARFKDFVTWDVKSHLVSLIVSNYDVVTLGEYIQEETIKIKPFEYPNDDFKILGVSNKIGLFDNEIKKGKDINQAYKIVKDGFLAYNPYRINVGSIGLKSKEQKYDLISPAYVVFSCKKELLPEYLFLIFKTKTFNKIINENTKGSVRQILSFDILEKLKIPLPSLAIQKKLVKNYHDKLNLSISQEKQIKEKDDEIEKYLYKELGIIENKKENEKLLNFINFKQLDSWSYRDVINAIKIESNLYHTIKLEQNNKLYIDIYRGKSPKYDDKSNTFILNQKCIRWNEIDLRHIKKVNKDWYNNIDKEYFTQENDILINSTGDGTIGRTVCIKKQYTNLIYDSHILLLRINQQQINANFLTYYLNSSLVQKQIENIKSAVATKQTELGINNLKKLQLILPPLEIQKNIANYISKLKEQINTLKQQAKENKTLALEKFEKEIFIISEEYLK